MIRLFAPHVGPPFSSSNTVENFPWFWDTKTIATVPKCRFLVCGDVVIDTAVDHGASEFRMLVVSA